LSTTPPKNYEALDQWVTWKYELRDDDWTKPLFSYNGTLASSTDAATWSSIHRAVDAYQQRRTDGIGFVLSIEDPFVGIDLDHCFCRETRKVEPWAFEILQKFKSYSEFSPSGQGIRIFVKGTLPNGIRGKKKGNIEVYSASRYLTVTGHRLKNAPLTIESRQAEIDWLFQKFFTEPKKAKPKPSAGNGAWNGSDDELLLKTFVAENGDKVQRLFDGDISDYASQSEADLGLCSLLGFWAQDESQLDRLFRRSALMRDKWG
jgi:primase-polymerase (primpol)-like protein